MEGLPIIRLRTDVRIVSTNGRLGDNMKGQDVLFSKASDEWETPQWLFDLLNKEFDFQIDIAATQENTKCIGYFDKETNALTSEWISDDYDEDDIPIAGGFYKFFLNPPYSQIAAFMKKAYEESLKGATVVCLIPCRTDTKYWHNYVMQAQEIRFVKGRLKFNNRTLPSWKSDGSHKLSSATFPSCVVIFDVSQCPLMVAYGFNIPRIGKTITKPQPLSTNTY